MLTIKPVFLWLCKSVIFRSPDQIPLPPLPPQTDDLLTGGRDQKQQISGDFLLLTEKAQRLHGITPQSDHLLPLSTRVSPVGWSWPLTSPQGSDGGQQLPMRPVLTLPASPVSLVSLCLGPSGVAAARTVTPEMESHVKVECSYTSTFHDRIN